MSILSTVALLAAAVTTKIRQIKPEPLDAKITNLQAKINGLNAGLTKLEAQIDDLIRERDSWYELMQAWRTRYYELRDAPRAQQQFQRDYALLQAHQAMQQRTGAQNLQTNMLLGAQNLQQSFEVICNCVPARHDMFARSHRQ